MMKLKLLPLAIGAVVVAQSGSVLADATVYGKLNISFQNNNFDYVGRPQQDNWTLNSNSSRLGVKGKSKINDDMDAVFKMEYETYVDNGFSSCNNSNNTFCQRNIYAGLSSKTYGMLYGGKNDTVLKMAADGTDMFNDLVLGDITNYMVGENRENNSIIYTSPVMAGFTFSTSTILGEQSGVNNAGNQEPFHDSIQQNSGPFDSSSSAIKYEFNEKNWVALAGDWNVENADIIRLVSQVSVGDFTFDAHIQSANNHFRDQNANNLDNGLGDGMIISNGRGYGLALNNTVPPAGTGSGAYYAGIQDQDAWMVNGKYQMGDWAFKAQVGESYSTSFKPNTANNFNNGVGSSYEFDTTQVAIGADYALSKNVTLFSYLAQLDVDSDNAAALVDDGTLQTGGVGLEIKF
ncbi:MAG TPA: porin [Pseudomonadales bacterium]|nr:porin [Pseudomonadales bacterium]